MKKLFLFFTVSTFLFSAAEEAHAQLNLSMGYHSSTAHTFTWEDAASDFVRWGAVGFDWSIGYRFKEKTGRIFSSSPGLQIHLQRFQRGAFETGYTHMRIPLKYTTSLPIRIMDTGRPLFEYNAGLGYYLSKPTHGVGLPFGSNINPNYWSHGLLIDFGLTFHIQEGVSLFVSFHQGLDVGQFSVDEMDFVQQFIDRGLTVGYSSSFVDLGRRIGKLSRQNK